MAWPPILCFSSGLTHYSRLLNWPGSSFQTLQVARPPIQGYSSGLVPHYRHLKWTGLPFQVPPGAVVAYRTHHSEEPGSIPGGGCWILPSGNFLPLARRCGRLFGRNSDPSPVIWANSPVGVVEVKKNNAILGSKYVLELEVAKPSILLKNRQ